MMSIKKYLMSRILSNLFAFILCLIASFTLYGSDLTLGEFTVNTMQATPGNCDGTLVIEATGSAGPFTVEIIPEEGDIINLELNDFWEVPNLCSGLYRIIFRNQMGCSFEQDPVQILECELEFSEDVLEGAITNPSTCNSNDGSIYFRFDLPYSGGMAPYTLNLYDNNDNLVPNSFPNSGRWNELSADNYFFVAEDAEGCMVRHEFTLGSDIIIEVDFSYDSPCINESNGELELIVSSGNEYEVLWNTGQTQELLQNIPAGNYCVTVTDALQCERVECFELEPVTSTFSLDAAITDVCSNRRGSIVLSSGGLQGQNSQIDFVWQDNNSTNYYRENLSVGEYCVDATNCGVTITQCFQIEYENTESIPIVVDAEITPVCLSPLSGTGGGGISLNVSGGNGGGFRYSWSNGETTSSINNLFLANYCVTVTNEAECVLNTERRCFQMEVLDIDINLESITHCEQDGCDDAFLNVSATANYPGQIRFDWYSYLPNGEYYERINTSSINDIVFSGEYCVKAYMVGENSCSSTQCFTIEGDCINVTDLPNINDLDVTVWPTSEFFPTGAIYIDYFPGFERTLFSWTGPNGGTSLSPNVDPANGAGTYTLTIDNGCDEPQSRTFILENCNSDFGASVIMVNSDCANDGYAFIDVEITGLEPNTNYFYWNGSDWRFLFRSQPDVSSTGRINNIRVSDGAGNYSIFLRNEAGCASEALFTVQEGTLDPTETPFYFLTRSGQGDSWVPTRCDYAVFCGDNIVDARQGGAIETTAVPLPNGGCELRFTCDDQERELILQGVSARGVTPDYSRRQCISGEICEVEDFIENPIFARITNRPIAPFRITTSGVLSQLSSSDMLSEIEIRDGRCIETLSCERNRPLVNISTPAQRDLECVRDATPWCRNILVCPRDLSDGGDVIQQLGPANVPSGSCCGAVAPNDSPSSKSFFFSMEKRHLYKKGIKYIDLSITSSLEQYYLTKPDYGTEDWPKYTDVLSPSGANKSILKVSPNPFVEEVNVQIKRMRIDDDEEYEIAIFDLKGRRVLVTRTKLSSLDMNLASLSNGLYILKVSSNTFTSSTKIVKR